jgi:hypothetical protein
MIEVDLLHLYEKIIEDYEKSSYFTNPLTYMENLRKWLLAEHRATLVSDAYGGARTTPVLQFKTEQEAVLFTLRYR